MNKFQCLFGVVVVGLMNSIAQAEDSLSTDPSALHSATLSYVRGLPGIPADARIEVSNDETVRQLAACEQWHFQTPSRAMEANFRVQVRCEQPQRWSVFLTVSVYQLSQYFVLQQAVNSQTVLTEAHFRAVSEYKLRPQPGLVADSQRIIGLKPVHAMKAGSAIRYTDLSTEPSLSRGQKVRVLARGKGFEIHQEGQLLSDAYNGELTRVQLGSRKIVNGVARSGGTVEINE